MEKTDFIYYINMAEDLKNISVYETSACGNKLARLNGFRKVENTVEITVDPEKKGQKIEGFGGSFTQSSAWLFSKLGKANQKKVTEAYFGASGARYSMTRTHMASCDFSLYNYTYAPVKGDKALRHFSIEEDQKYLIPMIKAAQAVSEDGFKIISSPWTAPPWMKDNNSWCGGKLRPEYHSTWAAFFSRYLKAYQKEGIPVWGITVNNEPLGNDSNWEIMHFTPQEMNHFVAEYLGPELKEKFPKLNILGFDQNRGDELRDWADAMFGDKKAAKYYDGTAVHWYGSTYEVFPENLNYVRNKSPEKLIIQTEACIDAQVPVWQDDAWYWSKKATDWGYEWAPEENRHLHPKYVPAFRYARDMIGCLNSGVHGWIDWNMILDRQGGPNWAKNWCIAPVIADIENDEVYFTPLFYVITHFSRFIRPGAVRLDCTISTGSITEVAAAENPDGSVAVVLFNPDSKSRNIKLHIRGKKVDLSIKKKALQTVIIPKNQIFNS